MENKVMNRKVSERDNSDDFDTTVKAWKNNKSIYTELYLKKLSKLINRCPYSSPVDNRTYRRRKKRKLKLRSNDKVNLVGGDDDNRPPWDSSNKDLIEIGSKFRPKSSHQPKLFSTDIRRPKSASYIITNDTGSLKNVNDFVPSNSRMLPDILLSSNYYINDSNNDHSFINLDRSKSVICSESVDSKIISDMDDVSENLDDKIICEDLELNCKSESIYDEYINNDDSILDDEIKEEENISPEIKKFSKHSDNDVEFYNLSISDHDSRDNDDNYSRDLYSNKSKGSQLVETLNSKLKKSDFYEMNAERFNNLNINDICLLLHILGLVHYVNIVLEFCISGTILLNCTELDLIQLGFNYQPHRAKLMKFLKKIRLTETKITIDKSNTGWDDNPQKIIDNEIARKLFLKKKKSYLMKNPLESTLKYVDTMEKEIDPKLLLSYNIYRDKDKLNFTVMRKDKSSIDNNSYINRESYRYKFKKLINDNRTDIKANFINQENIIEVPNYVKVDDKTILGSMGLTDYQRDNYYDEIFEKNDVSVKSKSSNVESVVASNTATTTNNNDNNNSNYNNDNNQSDDDYSEWSLDAADEISEQNSPNIESKLATTINSTNVVYIDSNSQINSVAMIQFCWRRYVAVKQVNKLRHIRQDLKKQLARKFVEMNRIMLQKQNAAIRIQCFLRSRFARCILKSLKVDKEKLKYHQKINVKNALLRNKQLYQQNQAAIKIQTFCRKIIAINILQLKLLSKHDIFTKAVSNNKEYYKTVKAALSIQARWRGVLGRNYWRNLVYKKFYADNESRSYIKNHILHLYSLNEKMKFVLRLQRCWRRYVAVKQVNKLRHIRQDLKKQLARKFVEMNRIMLQKQNAAIRIQCFVRSRFARCILKSLKVDKEKLKYHQKINVKNALLRNKQLYQQNQAAIKIQNRFRVIIAMRLLNGLIKNKMVELSKHKSSNIESITEKSIEKSMTRHNEDNVNLGDHMLCKNIKSTIESDTCGRITTERTNEVTVSINEIVNDTSTNIVDEAVPTIIQTQDSDWLLVDDGTSKFYFNKITKECSFEPQVSKSEVITSNTIETVTKTEIDKAFDAQVDSTIFIEWQLRKKNSVMIEKVEDFEIYMDFQLNKPFYVNVTTEEYSWDIPNVADNIREKLVTNSGWQYLMDRSISASTMSTESNNNSHSRNLWTVYYDPITSRHFFYNRDSNTSTWTIPQELMLAATSKTKNDRPDYVRVTSFLHSRHVGSWELLLDKNLKQVYYYNKSTSESRWLPPSFLASNGQSTIDDTSYADIDDEADEIHAEIQSVHDFSELGL